MRKRHLLKGRPPAKIIVVFSVVVFVIATLTMFFTGAISALLFHLEVLGEYYPSQNARHCYFKANFSD